MAGADTSQQKLNSTLSKVVGILDKYQVNDWFIFFGTLLGIVRGDSCIEGDDDLDIMINHDYRELRAIFSNAGFTFTTDFNIRDSQAILKTEPSEDYGSVDFYMCDVNEFGDFHTPWHGVVSTSSYVDTDSKTFVYKYWNSKVLSLPSNYENKLINMYGTDWRVPQSNKSCRMGIGKV